MSETQVAIQGIHSCQVFYHPRHQVTVYLAGEDHSPKIDVDGAITVGDLFFRILQAWLSSGKTRGVKVLYEGSGLSRMPQMRDDITKMYEEENEIQQEETKAEVASDILDSIRKTMEMAAFQNDEEAQRITWCPCDLRQALQLSPHSLKFLHLRMSERQRNIAKYMLQRSEFLTCIYGLKSDLVRSMLTAGIVDLVALHYIASAQHDATWKWPVFFAVMGDNHARNIGNALHTCGFHTLAFQQYTGKRDASAFVTLPAWCFTPKIAEHGTVKRPAVLPQESQQLASILRVDWDSREASSLGKRITNMIYEYNDIVPVTPCVKETYEFWSEHYAESSLFHVMSLQKKVIILLPSTCPISNVAALDSLTALKKRDITFLHPLHASAHGTIYFYSLMKRLLPPPHYPFIFDIHERFHGLLYELLLCKNTADDLVVALPKSDPEARRVLLTIYAKLEQVRKPDAGGRVKE